MRQKVKIGNKEIRIRKAKIKARFLAKSVLTDSTWQYVEIFLRQKKASKPLFYWEQAYNFYRATQDLSLVSKPLTIYYCFLNATKALLTFNKIRFNTMHGVRGEKVQGHYTLQNEHITIKSAGILPALCRYMGEVMDGRDKKYTLKDILYNLQYIHRAYTLTFGNQSELFIPIKNPRLVYDKDRKKAWFEAQLEQGFSNNRILKKLIGFSKDPYYNNNSSWTIRRNKTFDWHAPRNNPTKKSKNALERYHRNIRRQLRYIYGTMDLWYIKRKDIKRANINRNTLTLTFIAMHRLSELSRYEPDILKRHLERKASWLLYEFITKAIVQFVDQISSEITGDDFRLTGFRT